MKHHLAALSILGITGLSALQAGSPPPPFTEANLLQLDAVAVDRNGVPVTDLGRDEFEVWISGLRVPIETFRLVKPDDRRDGGRTIVMIMDDVTVGPLLAPRVKEVAARAVNRMLPGDRMSVVTLSGETVENTGDRQSLLRAVNAYRGGMMPIRPDDTGQHVLKTITSLSRQLREVPGRKAIVAVGAPWVFDTPLPPHRARLDLRSEWVEAMRATASANVSLYVIDPGGLGMQGPTFSGAGGFARETGGHAFVNTNDYAQAVDRIWRETGNYYLIGVADPPVQRTADLRELDIRVLRRGVTVRARRGIAPGT